MNKITIPSIIAVMLSGCGFTVTQKAEGTGRMEQAIVIDFPICNNPVFKTKEDILECVRTCSTITVNGESKQLSDIIKGVQ